MKTNNIRLRPDRLNFPLDTCVVGKLSSSVWILYGDIPDDIEGMSVQVERVPDAETHVQPPNYTAVANEVTGASPRSFRCYFSPWYFPEASDDLKYHVLGSDSNGNPRWLGSGVLRVEKNPAGGSPVPPEIIPADTYIRNPVTGLYHKITAEVNDLGEITTIVDPEGIQR